MTSYNPGIPLATDNISTSQGQFLINFSQLNVQFGQDHVAFNTGSGNGTGFHNKVTFLNQNASIPTSSSGQAVAYANTISSITMPYYKRDGLSTVFPFSPIKAFVLFNANGGGVPTLQATSFNVASVSAPSVSGPTFSYTVTLSQAMRTTNYGIIMSSSNSSVEGYLILSTTQFQVQTQVSGTISGITWSVIVVEA